NGDILSLKAKELSADFVKNSIKKDIFDKGLFTINIDGNKTNLTGTIYVKDTTIKNVRILNNLITFVNTTPAIINPILVLPTLFRMGETNFDTNGYYVKDGYLNFDYDYNSKILNLPSYYTKSKMMDFKGRGTIDIGKETLHLPIDVIFLKDYSKFLNHIPILGYIITGEDGNFVTNIDIEGTFENQEFRTHTVKNTSDGIVNVIKRTFMTPFRLFENIKFEPLIQKL
ncbi:MAG: AsmA-like C-terminal domain-containing protein, partial [Arcobacter sp.]|nr:AsmA-like C-terminal domain-containing protein [Arcobacter sp.]